MWVGFQNIMEITKRIKSYSELGPPWIIVKNLRYFDLSHYKKIVIDFLFM